jgi:DNA-binding MarR family transcriptional regulator
MRMSTSNPRSPNASLTSRFHRLEQRVNLAVLEAVHEAGYEQLGPSHIAFLDQMGAGCRMGELANRLNVTPAAVSQLAVQLEKLGLVRRTPDARDGRAVVVEPTKEVERGWIVARAAVGGIESRWRSELGDRRFSALVADIERLVALDDG